MSALGDFAEALAPVAQGIAAGKLGGLELQRQLQQQQFAQGIEQGRLGVSQQEAATAAAQQQATAQYQQGVLAQGQAALRAQEARDLRGFLDNPELVNMYSRSAAGRRILEDRVRRLNELDPNSLTTVTSLQQQFSIRDAGLEVLRELDQELQQPNILLAHGIDPKEVTKYRQRVFDGLNDPTSSPAKLHDILYEHPRAADAALKTVAGSQGGTPGAPPGMPDTTAIAQLFGFQPRQYGPQPGPAPAPSYDISQFLGPAASPTSPLSGIAAAGRNPAQQNPEQGDALPTPQMPAMNQTNLPQPPALGLDPRLVAALGSGPPAAPANPLAGILGQLGAVAPPQNAPALQRFAAFNPVQEAQNISMQTGMPASLNYPEMEAKQKVLSGQAEAEQALQFRGMSILKASVDLAKSTAETQKELSSIGLEYDKNRIDRLKTLIEAQGKQQELGAQVFGHEETFAAAQARLTAEQWQNLTKDAQNAVSEQMKGRQQQAMLLRTQLQPLIREDIASQPVVNQRTGEVISGNGALKFGLAPGAGVSAMLNEMGSAASSVTVKQFYNTEQHQNAMKVLGEIHRLENENVPFMPTTPYSTWLGTHSVTQADKDAVLKVAGKDGSNIAPIMKEIKSYIQGNDDDKAKGLFWMKVYNGLFPAKPLPLNPNALANPEGLAAKQAITANAPAMPAGGVKPQNPPVPGAMGGIGRGLGSIGNFAQGAAEQTGTDLGNIMQGLSSLMGVHFDPAEYLAQRTRAGR